MSEKEALLASSAYYYIIYAGIMAASGLVAFACDRALKKISQKKSVP